MTQPDLGKHIAALRSSKGLTQQELADRCRVNIRTIQRIETGDVVPRKYTLNLLTQPLEMNLNELNPISDDNRRLSRRTRLYFLAGLVYAANSVLVVYDLITHTFPPFLHAVTTLVHIGSCLFFFGGFYSIGAYYRNRLLAVSSIIMPVLLALLNGLELLKSEAMAPGSFLLFVLMCVVMLLLGGGLLKEAYERKTGENGSTYRLAGIVTIVIGGLYLSLNPTIVNVGLLLSVPGNLVLVYILYREMNDAEKDSGSIVGRG